jgi:tetratricopeptide (TPR) repeat protein
MRTMVALSAMLSPAQARGAAYANQGSLTKAVEDFETALSIDPADANAAKYLAATRAKLARTAPAHPSTAPPPESPSDRAGSGASASTGVGRAPPLAAPSAGQAGSGSELERALAEAAARAKQKRKRNKEKKRSKRKARVQRRATPSLRPFSGAATSDALSSPLFGVG